jgi:hypothetical protein
MRNSYGVDESSPSTPKQAIARMRSSIVSINHGNATQPIGSGVIVRGGDEDRGIVATALHVVREVAPDELQIGFPVPPSEALRGGLTMCCARVVATDEGNDLALLEMADAAPARAAVAELEAARPDDGEAVMISGLSNAIGAAIASVIAVGLLSILLTSAFGRSDLPPKLETTALFDNVDFVSNHELRSVLGATGATPAQVARAVKINEDARRRALQASFLIVAGVSLLAIFPATRLPRYAPGELSAEEIVSEAS